jgi:hypothetical protein
MAICWLIGCETYFETLLVVCPLRLCVFGCAMQTVVFINYWALLSNFCYENMKEIARCWAKS